MFLLCHAGMGLKSCRGDLALWCSAVRTEAAEVAGAFQMCFLWQGFHDTHQKDNHHFYRKTPGTRSWARWPKTKSCAQTSGQRLPISEAVTRGNQGGKLFNPNLECVPAMYRVQWLFRKKCIFTFQGCYCSPVSPLKVCSGGACKCVLGEKTWLKSKAFISDVFGMSIGRHILRAF